MSIESLKDEIREAFSGRRFAAGLALAILAFLRKLDAPGNFVSLDQLLLRYPRVMRVRGAKANTLIVDAGGKSLSIRKFYDKYEQLFRSDYKRFDYPNAAPHATQAWGDYKHWFDWMLSLSQEELVELEKWTIDLVLEELPSHEVDPSTIRPLARPFSRLLAEFPTTGTREPRGATFQGMVFAYIRADAPHLFLEVAKVGAGSKRLQRVGDIDGWLGQRLVITVECKSFGMNLIEVRKLDAFLGEARARKALASVAALSFDDEARAYLKSKDARMLDLPRLRSLVDLWDPLKQQSAYEGFAYYAHHVEKNAPLMHRLAAFTEQLASESDGV